MRTLDNNRYPLDHYMGFGWDGLRNCGYEGLLSDEDSDMFNDLQAILIDNTSFNPQNYN